MNSQQSFTKISLALGALLGLAGSAHAATNLVTNGSFESFSACTTCMYEGSDEPSAPRGVGDSNNLTGWNPDMENGTEAYVLTASMANAGVTDWHGKTFNLKGNVTPSPDGGNFAAVNAWGGLSTHLSGLVTGQTYDLSFYMATTSRNDKTQPPGTEATVHVGLNNTSVGDVGHLTTTSSFSGWTKYTSTFVFGPYENNSLYFYPEINTTMATGEPITTPIFLIDGVTVTQSVSAVPEPANAALLALGLLSIGCMGLRRRQQQ